MPASWMPLRSARFYEKHGVERIVGHVETADATTRSLTLTGGEVVTGDALLLAPGGVPRRLTAPGADLPGVFTLRTWDDCEKIVAALDGARTAVIAGSSFIGLEAAASLRHRGLEVTVVAPEAVPFTRLFGDAIGGMVRALHEENGVTFRLGRVVSALGGDGRVRAVTLDDGEELPADVVIAGIGIVPATQMIRGLGLLPDGSVPVDGRLRAAPGVWAAGDVATYPAAHLGEPVRSEHWRLALQHGRAAGFSMAGRNEPFTGVPFFWSQQYGTRVSFAGYGGGWDRLVVAGDVAGRDFVACFCAGDRVRAACGTRDRQIAAFAELMRTGALPSADELDDRSEFDFTTLLD
jgi:NADPH-dependent 2,4-dienoyl-CoA reductase/sulfur reductase-like enzyme